ncbi:MAG: IPT/TIG domain-containing protein [Thermoanaerobaculia bacterium]
MKHLLFAIAFLATSATAAPVITSIDPPQGFTFSTTHVTLRGSSLADGNIECGFGVECPVTVSFGTGKATVLSATPADIKVLVYPQAAGAVDVRVAIAGKGETVLPAAFRFDPNAIGSPEDYVRYLFPVVKRDLPGANGSLWTTEFRFRNRWEHSIPVIGPLCPPLVDPCFNPTAVPGATTAILLPQPRGDGADGAFLYVPQSLNDPKPAFTLRVRDLSKNATSFGTEIHTPQADEYQRQIDLIEIPTDERYRATLRIYGSSGAPQQVRIRTFAEPGNIQIDEQIVTLSGILTIVFDPFPYHPAYLQLDPLPPAVRASGDRVRVTVDVMGENVSPPPPPVWALVTVTDNVTQLTSTITPNR